MLSVFYLKNILYRHHFTALALIVIGTIVVGLALILKGDT
jgi:uncharacterized protein (DUF486 family)